MNVQGSWTIVRLLAPAPFMRQYELREPEDDATGLPMGGLECLAGSVMNGTPVPDYFDQLASIGLPFRVNILCVAKFTDENFANLIFPTFQLPPFTIEPTNYEGITNWGDFLQLLRQSLMVKIQNMQGLPSSAVFSGIVALYFGFVPLNNLAAFQQQLPNLIGEGRKGDLPDRLLHKYCCKSILNDDKQCLRCCVMAHVLELYHYKPDHQETTKEKKVRDEHNHNCGYWNHYLQNPRRGRV